MHLKAWAIEGICSEDTDLHRDDASYQAFRWWRLLPKGGKVFFNLDSVPHLQVVKNIVAVRFKQLHSLRKVIFIW